VFSALDKALALRTAPLFSSLPAEALLPVAVHSEVVHLDEDDLLFQEGELGDALYIVLRGSVDVVGTSGDIIATLGEGECVGEMAVLDWEPRSASVIARTNARLLRVDRNELVDLLADRPALVMNLARVLAARIRQGR